MLVLEVIKCVNVPKMDVGSESDPFVKIILQDENGKKKISFKTPSKEDASML